MKKTTLTLLAFLPSFAFAQEEFGNLETFATSIGGLVGTLLPVVVGIALLAFFWGLVKFIFAQGNEESKSDAKKTMVWGVIALFVMVSVWGLVGFIGDAFGIEQGESLEQVPSVPIPGV
ncbi:MAG: pilin [Patescibacteria group bacterium]